LRVQLSIEFVTVETSNGQALSANPLIELVGREGIEPSTNGLRGGVRLYSCFVNQVLASLANLEISVIQSQFRHSQSELVTK
jgi:hypothetical protein